MESNGKYKKYTRTGRLLPMVAAALLIVAQASCTKGFRDMNSDRTGITDEEMEVDFNDLGHRLGIIQQGIYFNYDFGKGRNWPFQLTQNLSADMFSGYLHDAKPLNGGSHNSDYNLQDGWNSAQWLYAYSYVMPELFRSENATREHNPDFFGVTKVLKVLAMHRVTDYYGPIVYSHFGEAANLSTPDTQQQVYNNFFADLDSAVTVLTDYTGVHPVESAFARFDILLDGKYATWIKLANSLRMRLAVRIATADPETAREQFLKAFRHPKGVLDDAQNIAAVSTSGGYTNPLGELNRVWNEVYMNASMESILTGYDDPRLEHYFEPCTRNIREETAPGKIREKTLGAYRGIRQGTCFAHNLYSALSKATINTSTPPVLMSAAEIWFLRAEAALRGWTSENVRDCYETGIRCSFARHGVTGAVEAYLQSDRQAADFIDALTPENDIDARCQVTPRWDEAATLETKLERIITQKWLAMFPEGCEAWAEQRRTGYPRLFPVRFNNSHERCIDTETMIRRLNFPGFVVTGDPQLYESLCAALDGDDHGGTRLWWDTGRNF